jgi:hypothetical protein
MSPALLRKGMTKILQNCAFVSYASTFLHLQPRLTRFFAFFLQTRRLSSTSFSLQYFLLTINFLCIYQGFRLFLIHNKMLYFALRAFGFLVTNIKITIYCSPPLLSFSPLPYSFIHLPAVFSPYFSPFPPLYSLSFRRMCWIDRVTSCTFSLSSPSFPSLFSLSSSLPLQPAIIFLSHTHSLPSLLYFDSLSLSLLSYLSVSLSLYLFIHLLLVHFLAGRLLILSFF